jgi:hypothetical protein
VLRLRVPLKFETPFRVIVTAAEFPGRIFSWDGARAMVKSGGKGITTVMVMESVSPLHEADTVTE